MALDSVSLLTWDDILQLRSTNVVTSAAANMEMGMIKGLSVAAALALSLSLATSASAASIQVGFSILPIGSSLSRLEGTLTFDSIGDETANGVTFSTIIYGDDQRSLLPSQYNGFLPSGINSFRWSDAGAITDATFRASAPASSGIPNFDFTFFQVSVGFQIAELRCVGFSDGTDNNSGQLCRDLGFDIVGAPVVFNSPTTIAPIPVPASLPLFLASLGGLAIFWSRKSRLTSAFAE